MATQSLSDPTTGQKIPAFLQGVEGVVFGRSVPTLGQSRIVISSLPKVGKSSLAHSNPKAFALDPESGGRSVRNPAALRFGPMVRPNGTVFSPKVSDYRAVLDKLIVARRTGQCALETIVLDTVDYWLDLHGQELAAEAGVTDISQYSNKHG